MNFIGQTENTLSQRELKYCERCGGLFLRLSSSEIPYCTFCQAHWTKLLEMDEVILRKSNKCRIRKRKARVAGDRKRGGIQLRTLRGCSMSEVSAC